MAKALKSLLGIGPTIPDGLIIGGDEPPPPTPIITGAVERARSYVRAQMRTSTRIKLGVLTDDIIELLSDQDPGWVQAFLREVIYDIVQKVVAESRPALPEFRAPPSDGPLLPAPRKAPKQTGWALWWERTQTGGHVLLPDMTKEELIEARDLRLAAAKRNADLARAWADLIDALEPGQRVKDVFTPDELGLRVDRIIAAEAA